MTEDEFERLTDLINTLIVAHIDDWPDEAYERLYENAKKKFVTQPEEGK